MKREWKIRIDDGYCEYEYQLLANNPKVSIHDVYQLVRNKLKAEECEAKYVSKYVCKKTGKVIEV
jgi:uncharacterized protein YdbL (DUF1318 family)